MPPQLTYAESCRILEISADATPEEIQRGYRRLAMLWHPDRFDPDSPLRAEALQKIESINEAYRFLREHPQAKPSPEPAPPPPEARPRLRPAPGRRTLWILALCFLAGAAGVGSLNFRRREGPLSTPVSAPVHAPVTKDGAMPPPAENRALSSRPTTLEVDQPTLVIFWPSDAELNETPERKATVAAFLGTAGRIQEKVRSIRPELAIHLTDAEIIQFQGLQVCRSQTCGYGYLLCSLAKGPMVLEGTHDIGEVMGYVEDNFPLQDSAIKPE